MYDMIDVSESRCISDKCLTKNSSQLLDQGGFYRSMPYSITSGYQVIRDTLGNEKVDAFGEKRHIIYNTEFLRVLTKLTFNAMSLKGTCKT